MIPKAPRISLSPQQSNLLKTVFATTEMPSTEQLEQLGTETGLYARLNSFIENPV